MSDVYTECNLEELFAARPTEVRKTADRELRDMLLAQASRKGYSEVVRVAKELGGDVDVVVHFPDRQDCHVQMALAA